jgi:hypothetical protein
MDEEEVFLTGAEVSKILGLSSRTLRRLRQAGALDTYYKGVQSTTHTNARPVYSATNVADFLRLRNTITKQPTQSNEEVK